METHIIAELLLGLGQNIALVFSLVLAYSMLIPWLLHERTAFRSAVVGILFGAVAMLGMLLPVHIMPGVIIDGRVIIVSTAGLIGGPVTAGVAALIPSAYRIYLGGAGAVAGVCAIMAGAVLGAFAGHFWAQRHTDYPKRILMLFGLGVAVQALAWTFLLPADIALAAFKLYFLPVIISYPLGILLLGSLLVHAMQRHASIGQLRLEKETIKRQADALQVFSQRLGAHLKNTPLGVIEWNLDFEVVDWNNAATKIFGYSREEAIGRNGLDLVVPRQARSIVQQVWDDLGRGEGGTRSTNLNTTRSGKTITCDWYNTTLRGTDGSIIGVASLVEDITNRELAGEALRKAKEFTDKALNAQNDTFFLFEPATGKALRWNKSFRDITGYSDAEIAAMPAPDSYFSPEDLKRTRAFVGKVVREGMGTIELDLICKDRRTVPAEYNVSVIKDDHGKPKYIISIGRDISERKQAQKDLYDREAKLRAIFDQTFQLMALLSVDGTVLDINRTALDFIGAEKAEVIGKPFWDIPGWNYAPPVQEKLRAAVKKAAAGELVQYEAKNQTGSGEIRTISFSLKPIMDDAGNVIYLNPEGNDITDQRRAEQEGRELEASLRQAQKMEAIGTLAGGIAHDFNNILSAVIGFAELAKMNAAKGQDSTMELDEVLSAGLRARDLVKHILTFSRKATVQKNPVKLQPLIKEALHFVRASVPTTIEVTSNLGASDSMVMADATQINQVLMNLCTNASHAMKGGVGKLSVEMDEVLIEAEQVIQYKEIEKGRYARITVSDTGCGIPQKMIDRIFDPFFTSKDREEGTGLGLSVVHGIVKEMGGAISVYSEVGQGTTFQVLFPLLESETLEMPEPPAPIQRGRGHILIVDDEAGIVTVAKKMLTSLGYNITSTTSSVEAFEWFRASPGQYDLVLTDMTMPELTGLDLSRRMLEIRPDTPIILCTGFSAAITPVSIERIGIRKMIMKPLIMGELSKTVAEVLNPGPE